MGTSNSGGDPPTPSIAQSLRRGLWLATGVLLYTGIWWGLGVWWMAGKRDREVAVWEQRWEEVRADRNRLATTIDLLAAEAGGVRQELATLSVAFARLQVAVDSATARADQAQAHATLLQDSAAARVALLDSATTGPDSLVACLGAVTAQGQALRATQSACDARKAEADSARKALAVSQEEVGKFKLLSDIQTRLSDTLRTRLGVVEELVEQYKRRPPTMFRVLVSPTAGVVAAIAFLLGAWIF